MGSDRDDPTDPDRTLPDRSSDVGGAEDADGTGAGDPADAGASAETEADGERGNYGPIDAEKVGDDRLTILLIEDNDGDARLIEEMLQDAGELLQRIDPEAPTAASPRVSHETRLEAGLETLESSSIDVVLLDLNLPDSTGLDTLETVVDAAETAPVVVLTGLRDRRVGIRAIQHGAQDYLVKDEVTSDLLVRSLHHAIERKHQELARQRRREQLEAINRLNEISQDVTHLVITTSSREELEERVCQRLTASDAYRFAWIGTVDRGSDRVTPAAAAGVEEGYLEEITVTVNDGETAQGPAGTAIRTQEVQVMQNVRTEPQFEPWRQQAREREYRSSAAVPIVHEDVLYGVLNVYAATPEGFSDPARATLARLGEIVGHAIAAIERRDALLGEAVLELEFRANAVAEPLVELTDGTSCTVRFERIIPAGDSLLIYGTVAELSQEQFCEAIEAVGWADEVRFLSPDHAEYEFELHVSEPPSLLSVVANHNGRFEAATIDDGEFRFVVELPRSGDPRQLIEALEAVYSDVVPVAQRTGERRPDEAGAPVRALDVDLTEKQRSAIETAYFAGYFEWPRASTGEEVAEQLGISPATFNQHLRTAQRKFFEATFESGAQD